MMRIKDKIQIHDVAGEKIAMLHEKDEMTRVISFNDTALYLWNSLNNKDFVLDDVTALLLEKYDVDMKTAKKDAANWLKTIQDNGLLE